MSETICVKHPLHILQSGDGVSSSIKREAVLFARIAVPKLQKWFSEPSFHLTPDFIGEFDWLTEQGLVFDPENLQDAAEFAEHHPKLESLHKVGCLAGKELYLLDEEVRLARFESNPALPVDLTKLRTHKNLEDFVDDVVFYLTVACDCEVRVAAVQLQEQGTEARPAIQIPLTMLSYVLGPETFRDTKPNTETNTKTTVMEIVLNQLPMVMESTSWDEIIEFRSDPDSYHKFLDFRNWMNEVARGQLTPLEVEQKLEYLVSQYQRHMSLHKMKANTGRLETVIVSVSEILEDLMHFKFSSIARSMFSIKQRQINLIEGELTSPGSEVAFLIKVKERFG